MGGQGSGRRPTPGRRRRILELRAAGLTPAEIAQRSEVTHQAVQQHLKPDPDRCRLIPEERLLSGKFGGVDRGRRELGATNRRRGKREYQPKASAGRQ